MKQQQILLVDDDVSLLRLLSIRLAASGYKVDTASSGRQALARINASPPQIVISDYKMDELDGMQLFEQVQQEYPGIPFILLTAHGSIPAAVDATRKGVTAYLAKPFNSDELLREVQNALSLNPLRSVEGEWRSHIISQSPLIEDLLQQCYRVAQADSSILIQGDSGTGKELFARAIHAASPRRDHPFIAINCTAIPHHLLESELFGHRKGAFTGATSNHQGILEAANQGTLLLDEIGDMPLEFQAKLLRSLEDKTVKPVGSSQSIAINIRVISATHVDLEKAVAEKQFREDLYYRLNVVTLNIPPLQERREDIPLLARHFLQRVRERNPHCVAGTLAPDAMELLLKANWPGNIRQLLNVIEQLAILNNSQVIGPQAVQRALKRTGNHILPLEAASLNFERDYLVRILKATKGNVTRAASIAKRNRTEFYKLLKKHQIEAASFRKDSASS